MFLTSRDTTGTKLSLPGLSQPFWDSWQLCNMHLKTELYSPSHVTVCHVTVCHHYQFYDNYFTFRYVSFNFFLIIIL